MTPKIALISGGNRGLGRAGALELASRGVNIVLTYRSNQQEAAQVVSEVESRGSKALALALDVGKVETFGAFADTLRTSLANHWGAEKIDYLVNNAGHGVHASFESTTEAQFDELMNVHLKGVFFLTQKLLPLLRDGGAILNVSSGLARFSMAGYAAYGAMKGGIEVLTRYLATELGPRKIRVNTLAPGAIATDFGGGAVRDNAEVQGFLASMTALGRVGQPHDIGTAMAMLLSDDAGWINAQRIEASGGVYI
jgi:NAD(P)-dependent dehydrogenase (short-subunit alcohol dehydrogenase family)